MTTTVTEWIDALAEPVPDGFDVVALKMTWTPVPGQDPEERIIRLGDISPADDRIAVEICGRSVLQAVNLGPPTAHMVVWFVAGHQMRLKREPWRQLEHRFTLTEMSRAQLLAGIEPSPEPEPVADDNPLDAIDLDRDDLLKLPGIAPEEADRIMAILDELTEEGGESEAKAAAE